MKTVVSNTSPIRYLRCIGEHECLPRLFGKIFIPKAVFQELTATNTPDIVREFMESSPDWIEVCKREPTTDSSLSHLDAGERAAILLAESLQADLLLIDEKQGRLTARDRGLAIAGVLGILELAAIRYHIDLPQAIDKLLRTNMKVSPSLITSILNRHYQRLKHET